VVVQSVGEAAPRGRVQLVEGAEAKPRRQAQRRQVGEVPLPLLRLAQDDADEVLLVEAVLRQRQQLAAALEVDRRADGGDAAQAGGRVLEEFARGAQGD